VPDQFYVRVPMKLEISGRYHQIAKFFYGVSQLDRIINLENVNLGKPEIHGEDVIVHADVLATAFRAAEDAKDVGGDKRGGAIKEQQ
jgi:type IV pilus assembly protein PilO